MDLLQNMDPDDIHQNEVLEGELIRITQSLVRAQNERAQNPHAQNFQATIGELILDGIAHLFDKNYAGLEPPPYVRTWLAFAEKLIKMGQAMETTKREKYHLQTLQTHLNLQALKSDHNTNDYVDVRECKRQRTQHYPTDICMMNKVEISLICILKVVTKELPIRRQPGTPQPHQASTDEMRSLMGLRK